MVFLRIRNQRSAVSIQQSVNRDQHSEISIQKSVIKLKTTTITLLIFLLPTGRWLLRPPQCYRGGLVSDRCLLIADCFFQLSHLLQPNAI
jgi:hypothetical protein